MADHIQPSYDEMEQTLVKIHRELNKLRARCEQLHGQNEKMRSELTALKTRGKSFFDGMTEKDRMACKQQISNLISRIDTHLPE
jgi:regulator of replication initiation timing